MTTGPSWDTTGTQGFRAYVLPGGAHCGWGGHFVTCIPFSFDRKPLAGDGALVKEELPAIVAEGP